MRLDTRHSSQHGKSIGKDMKSTHRHQELANFNKQNILVTVSVTWCAELCNV